MCTAVKKINTLRRVKALEGKFTCNGLVYHHHSNDNTIPPAALCKSHKSHKTTFFKLFTVPRMSGSRMTDLILKLLSFLHVQGCFFFLYSWCPFGELAQINFIQMNANTSK